MIAGLALDLLAAGPGPTCIRQNDRLVCGYHCTSNMNVAACAQTPDGMCASTPSQVVCWDPPPDVRWLMSTRDDLPQPKCVTSLNGAACGYDCEQTGDRVACADTPMGKCATRFGALRCFDPAPEVRWAMEAQGNLQQATCERTLDKVACGYACVSTLKRVKCAQTPWGSCTSSFDAVACFDPQLVAPPPMMSVNAPQVISN
ncbi:MAG TPA: hypothetical protein VGL86_23165 [Polyangia bacterium]|jgi:hypothetical protein